MEVIAADESPAHEDRESANESKRTGPGILAAAGVYTLQGVTFVFWDVPVFVLYQVPKCILWDGPAALVETLRSDRSRIEKAIADLREPPILTVEEERERFSRLEYLTGLTFTDRGEWIAWWNENRDEPPSRWRLRYVEAAFVLLESDDYWSRLVGADRLRRVSGIDSGYDAKASANERFSACAVWRAWWQQEIVPESR